MDWAERRNSERKRTLLQGRVVFNNRFSTIECTVKDLSGTGAQIAFEHPTEIPRQVELEIPSRGLA
ncbi:MAG: PilZ domain-containing protein, partial [Pseudomonadota bacterium]|nr:PilZ domain-containing protein [Pseudomonadota bacterium]